MLAEDNGGPLNAGYLRARVDRIAAGTRNYVPKVLDVWDRVKRQFESGDRIQLELMHTHGARDGKELAAAGGGDRP